MTHRILPLEKGHNFRELGGYQTKDGRTLKWHKVLRSASLAHLTPHDLAYLTDYGVRYDVDFRSPEETAKSPDKVPANAIYESLPVFKIDETLVRHQKLIFLKRSVLIQKVVMNI